MAAYQKFATFAQDFLVGLHNFEADTFNIMLTQVLPNAALDNEYSDITEITPQHGYVAGGKTIPNVQMNQVGMETIILGDSIVFTADGGIMGPFQYAVMYNASQAQKRLVAYWGYPTQLTLMDTETITIKFNPVDGIFKVV